MGFLGELCILISYVLLGNNEWELKASRCLSALGPFLSALGPFLWFCDDPQSASLCILGWRGVLDSTVKTFGVRCCYFWPWHLGSLFTSL